MLADHSRHCGELGRRLMRPPALLIVIVNVSRIFLLLFDVSVDYPIKVSIIAAFPRIAQKRRETP